MHQGAKERGKYIPDIVIAGGFVNETQILKAIAMSNLGDGHGPHVKAIAMARAPLTAVMKADYFVELAREGKLPGNFAQEYGDKPEQFLIATTELRRKYGDEVGTDIPWPAVGLYSYFVDRIGVGLKQLLAGCCKWRLGLLAREDVAALSERASRVTGIPTIDELASKSMQDILDF